MGLRRCAARQTRLLGLPAAFDHCQARQFFDRASAAVPKPMVPHLQPGVLLPLRFVLSLPVGPVASHAQHSCGEILHCRIHLRLLIIPYPSQ